MYYCYLIMSNKLLYTGITNNLEKRIRQHNGLIRGGAKYTRKSKIWLYHTIVGKFNTKSEACKFEWMWKHIKNKKNKWRKNKAGMKNKMERLIELLLSDQWIEKGIYHFYQDYKNCNL